jgi:hypothetical protein
MITIDTNDFKGDRRAQHNVKYNIQNIATSRQSYKESK